MSDKIPLPPGHIVMLGNNGAVAKDRAGAQVAAIPRVLDAQGTYEVNIVIGPDGQPMPVSDRSSYMDAEQLLSAIREIVKEELKKARRKER